MLLCHGYHLLFDKPADVAWPEVGFQSAWQPLLQLHAAWQGCVCNTTVVKPKWQKSKVGFARSKSSSLLACLHDVLKRKHTVFAQEGVHKVRRQDVAHMMH